MASREGLDIDYAMENRPVEPHCANEGPELWYEVAEWEAERADAYRDALTATEKKRDRLRKAFEYHVTRDQHQPDSVQLHGVDVFYNPLNRTITILYDPSDEAHNCDEMGCRASHVAVRTNVSFASPDVLKESISALHTETEGSDDEN